MSRIKAEFGVFKISKIISQGQGSEGRFNQDLKVLLFGAARTHICGAVVLVFDSRNQFVSWRHNTKIARL